MFETHFANLSYEIFMHQVVFFYGVDYHECRSPRPYVTNIISMLHVRLSGPPPPPPPFSLRTAGGVAIFKKPLKTFLFNKYL